MKFRFFIFSAVCFYACSAPKSEIPAVVKEEISSIDSKPELDKVEKPQNDTLEQKRLECEAFWKNRMQLQSLKNHYLDEILSKSNLSENNRKFLIALRNRKEDEVGFKRALSPIFRFSKTEIGITVSPEYRQDSSTFIPINKEHDFFARFDTSVSVKGTTNEIKFYPKVLPALLNGKSAPVMHYYTTKSMDTTTLVAFGSYGDECSDYYLYSLDTKGISISDELLFSSPFVIDLEFDNWPNIDVLVQKSHKEECMDCPSSDKFQKTFAKVKGTENLYFVFADTFPINNKLDTPSRALVLINEKKETVYLWYDEIDLFGCSCL